MSPTGVLPQLVGDLGTPELLIILVVVVLLFGSSKLPELARGSGRALRIFKAETKGLMDDDEPATPAAGAPATPLVPPVPPPATRPVATSRSTDADLEARRRELVTRQAELDAERARLHGESAAG